VGRRVVVENAHGGECIDRRRDHYCDHRAQLQKFTPGCVVLTVFFYFDFDWPLPFDAVVVLLVEKAPLTDDVLVGDAPLVEDGRFVVDVPFV
jgi:hypothetical protein